ncbi:hypothetical protein F4780DRAFT_774419 [Xylariomycetidae sp. FL0641]|nr:hypothetical protein F4780DRAFT_774419 [Xylariomycetidae sp. FL0641]
MSEYWKSTPKYWCKHCSTYVRDTKLERTNHEATGKHQGALKRFLRDLHRSHDQEQREKDRAKREVDRLNGIVPPPSSTSAHATASSSSSSSAAAAPAQRMKQWEQLAEMGIDVPTTLRGDMAMAGDWTVTNTRVIDDAPRPADAANPDAVAVGKKKRNRDEETEEKERAEDKAIQGLFKKPRKWGRDTRHAPEDDAELDALLRTSLTKKEAVPGDEAAPPKEDEELVKKRSPSPADDKADGPPEIKKEDSEDARPLQAAAEAPAAEATPQDANAPPVVKPEPATDAQPAPVLFKKRKPKNIRQK